MRYSRFVDGVIDDVDPWEKPHILVERLLSFSHTQSVAPILYYETDGYLAMVSRFREVLAPAFRFVLGAPDLVEDLLDKARFNRLAKELSLPVPVSFDIAPDVDLAALALEFPLIVKPLTRRDRDGGWVTLAGDAKALVLGTGDDFRRLMPLLRATGISLLGQRLIPGGETSVESYHMYARRDGEVVADFTGKKLRTVPAQFGHSTALITTDAPDVVETGRAIVRKLGLGGVAKLDFKRDARGQLHLLEVNPRFTLWNHLGAEAGVNIPSLVYDDLTGRRLSGVKAGRAGISWCDVPKDVRAARAAAIPLPSWLWWAARANIKTDLALDDPMPFLRGRILSKLTRVGQRARSRRSNATR
ncbi:MAG: ATP-grasp domain-containing protein [Chloroflexi bacterium]|nr:ATP-grasp domain-containing protein [Chloroflexota bacterium]